MTLIASISAEQLNGIPMYPIAYAFTIITVYLNPPFKKSSSKLSDALLYTYIISL